MTRKCGRSNDSRRVGKQGWTRKSDSGSLWKSGAGQSECEGGLATLNSSLGPGRAAGGLPSRLCHQTQSTRAGTRMGPARESTLTDRCFLTRSSIGHGHGASPVTSDITDLIRVQTTRMPMTMMCNVQVSESPSPSQLMTSLQVQITPLHWSLERTSVNQCGLR